VDQSGQISIDLNGIWKQTKILHEVQKDDTSFRFEEALKWFAFWFLDVSLWVRKLLSIIIIALLSFVCIYVVIQYVWKSCSLLERQAYEKMG